MSVKTIHLTNAYHPSSGGIRTFYRALLAAANAHRRLLRLVVPGPEDAVEEVGDFGRIYYVRAQPAPAFDRRYRFMFPSAYLPPNGSAITRILRAEQPDVVEICDKYSLFYLAALIRRGWIANLARPTLVGLSCERMDDNLSAFVSDARAVRRFGRWYIRNLYGPPFDYHIANSEYTADELRRALWDRSSDFIHVCGMGVDAESFSPSYRDRALRRSLLERAGGSEASVLLFYAGRLSPEKNPRLLIDALEQLTLASRGPTARDYRLVIAGDGPMAAPLVADAARRVPGRLLVLGSVESRQELARCYASADIFVHPNPREPFGIGPLEAMASGVPVVVPTAGGVLTYAHEGNSWLARADAESFAASIRQASDDCDPARVAAARATADMYRWSLVTGRLFDLYDTLDARFRVRRARVAGRPEQRLATGAPR